MNLTLGDQNSKITIILYNNCGKRRKNGNIYVNPVLDKIDFIICM